MKNPKRKAKFYYNVDIRKQPRIIKFLPKYAWRLAFGAAQLIWPVGALRRAVSLRRGWVGRLACGTVGQAEWSRGRVSGYSRLGEHRGLADVESDFIITSLIR